MANENLINFLIDDVTEIVNYINECEELQAIEIPDAHFETLGVFANYWSHHLRTLRK